MKHSTLSTIASLKIIHALICVGLVIFALIINYFMKFI